jgi:histidyl-tRNA synthetase
MIFAPPRGMRDFYPEDMRIRNKIFDAWKKAARLHGFEEYDAPVVETEELLIRKSGEEIVQQIYNFTDKSDRRLALRPEMTPSLARMVVARQKMLTYPLKWFSIPQCFRYERMTKGRKREHYQWNLDIIGQETVTAEAEILCTAITALKFLGLSAADFRVRVGNRALLADLFKIVGLADNHFMPVCMVLDKMGKITEQETRDLLVAEQLTESDISKVLELMALSSLEAVEARLGTTPKSAADLRALFDMMHVAGLGDFLEFDISIIRGLSYYTGIVFEAFDTKKNFRAIFGGGRYDNLLSSLGGEKTPCVGLGFGDVVIAELLNSLSKLDESQNLPGVMLGYMTDAEKIYARQLATGLRAQNIPVNFALEPEKAKKFFTRANKSGAAHTIYIGADEVTQQIFTIKNMTTGAPTTHSLEALKSGQVGL